MQFIFLTLLYAYTRLTKGTTFKRSQVQFQPSPQNTKKEMLLITGLLTNSLLKTGLTNFKPQEGHVIRCGLA